MPIIKLTEEQRQLIDENEHISVKQAYAEIMSASTSYNITAETEITVNGKVFKRRTSSISALRLNNLVAAEADIRCITPRIYDNKPHYPRSWLLERLKELLNRELGLGL